MQTHPIPTARPRRQRASISAALAALLLASGFANAQTVAAQERNASLRETPPAQRLAAVGLTDALEAAPPAAGHRHANAEHPGVLRWQQAQNRPGRIDTDHFTVLPPASVNWTLQSAR